MIDTTEAALRASVAQARLREGVALLYAGDWPKAETAFCAARAELRALLAMFEAEPPRPAGRLRKLALVGAAPRENDGLAPWMHTKKGEPEGAA